MGKFLEEINDCSIHVMKWVYGMMFIILTLTIITLTLLSYNSGEQMRKDEYLQENAFDYVMENQYDKICDAVREKEGSYEDGYNDGYEDGLNDQ